MNRGDMFAIICEQDSIAGLGNPKGTLQWFKDNSAAAIKNGTATSPIGKLDSTNLKREDSGRYSCRIANEVGSQEKSFQLIVLGEVSYVNSVNFIFSEKEDSILKILKWMKMNQCSFFVFTQRHSYFKELFLSSIFPDK